MDLAQAYRLTLAQVVDALETNVEHGLTNDEVRARVSRFGKNQLLAAKPISGWVIFLHQFQDILVLLLLAATGISVGLWLYERDTPLPYEAIAIFAIVVLNAALGYFQTSRAERAIASLKSMWPAESTVIRDGARQRIPAADLVPGDVILVEEGDTIPADARLVQSTALTVSEAALTGESLPVEKDIAPIAGQALIGDRVNMIFSGTVATYGRATAIVVGTGMQTEMGHIAGMLKSVPPETTPLQKQLNRTGKLLGLAVTIIAIIIVATLILAEHVSGFSALLDVLIFGVSLAVAAVPEGLPAVVTAVLSLGVQRMARRKAIVRHLSAVETLGSADVIASDKTGTLTKNEMTVRKVVTASGVASFSGTGYAPEGIVADAAGAPLSQTLRLELEHALTVADRANNASLQLRDGRWTISGDPTEGALLVAAQKAGLDRGHLESRFARVGEVPFSSERKLMSTIHNEAAGEERTFIFTKGAPDVLLGRCTHEFADGNPRPLDERRRTEILKTIEELGQEALRTLGVAHRTIPRSSEAAVAHESMERDLVFAGLVGMMDPPREEAQQAVARAHSAGVRSILITGDHPATATVIARELGIGGSRPAITGTDLERMSDDDLRAAVHETSVYARVSPEHKLRIVQALQHAGSVVGMTGDGVNDAPALKTADIGIAMGISGTDVSKEAADIVLADDNFATIIAAIEEGRAIFANIRKFLVFLLSSNLGEVFTMFFGVLLGNLIGLKAGENGLALPLTATQILWVNLVTDGAPALALGLDPADSNVMENPPRPRRESVITRPMWRGILLVGALMAAGTLFVLDADLPGGWIDGSGELRHAQTLAFNTLVLFQMFNIFNSRSREQSAFVKPFRNLWLCLAVALSIALQFGAIYLPFLQQALSTSFLNFNDWVLCTAVASSTLWLTELSKLVTRRAKRGDQ